MTDEIRAALGLLEEDGRFLLVANWRNFGVAPVLCWDVPGGGVNPGESLEAACVREFREETGLRVVVRDLAFMVERFGFKTGDPRIRSAFYYFHVDRAAGEEERQPCPEDAEIVDLGFKRVAEIRSECPHPYQQELLRWLDAERRPRYFLHRAAALAEPGPRPGPGKVTPA